MKLIKEKYNTKENIETRIKELALKDYRIYFCDRSTLMGALRERIIESDLRWLHNDSFSKTCLEDFFALLICGSFVAIFAIEFIKDYLMYGTALVIAHLALPKTYEISIELIDSLIMKVRRCIFKGKRNKIAREKAELIEALNKL